MRLAQIRSFVALVRDRRGIAAVEFALLTPLLLLMLGLAVEVGRMTIAYREFSATIAGIAKHVARYPEFEYRAREYAKPIPGALFPSADVGSLNVILYSLLKQNGALTEVFPGYVMFGGNPGVSWTGHVKATDYEDDEAVIFVGASYTYTPIFPGFSSIPVVFHKYETILPMFSRQYPWNDNQVNDNTYIY